MSLIHSFLGNYLYYEYFTIICLFLHIRTKHNLCVNYVKILPLFVFLFSFFLKCNRNVINYFLENSLFFCFSLNLLSSLSVMCMSFNPSILENIFYENSTIVCLLFHFVENVIFMLIVCHYFICIFLLSLRLILMPLIHCFLEKNIFIL